MDQSLLMNGPTLRRRQQRRSSSESRPVKRLFTPEIKKQLKSWLVRRRENPYPNREEKMRLAEQTGLTYVQICNWFANWRRKLKNSNKNVYEFTWTNLIKSYNDRVLGNVEHLSISSNDSIWQETEINRQGFDFEPPRPMYPADHCYSSLSQGTTSKSSADTSSVSFSESRQKSEHLPQCFQISSTTDFLTEPSKPSKLKSKYTNTRLSNEKPVRKRFRDKNWNCKKILTWTDRDDEEDCGGKNPPENFQKDCILSKWRKSAELFRPTLKTYSHLNYFRKEIKKTRRRCEKLHGREELDAAEALTFLSRSLANR